MQNVKVLLYILTGALPTLATLAGDIAAEGAGVKILEKHIKMESNTCTYWFTLKLEY